MCAQCMATAATAGAAATGIRAWLAAKAPGWLNPVRMRRITVALVVVAVAATAVIPAA